MRSKTQARITKKIISWGLTEFLLWNIQISAILFHRWRKTLQLRRQNFLITNIPKLKSKRTPMAHYNRDEINVFLDKWRYGWFNGKQNNSFETNLIIFR